MKITSELSDFVAIQFNIKGPLYSIKNLATSLPVAKILI